MIYLLMGKSGSGKTRIMEMLTASFPDITRVKTFTTRPQRDADDNEYVFVNKLTFEYMQMTNQMICVRTFTIIKDGKANSYYYGIKKSDLNGGEDRLMILDFKGYVELVNLLGDKVVGIYIYTPEHTRKERIKNRKGYDEGELNRRMKADDSDFDMDLMIEFGKTHQLNMINNQYDEKIALSMAEFIIKSTKKRLVHND